VAVLVFNELRREVIGFFGWYYTIKNTIQTSVFNWWY
jgi:hypothetical protein